VSAMRADRATYDFAEDAFFTVLRQRISEESDPANLLDLIIQINTLLDLLDEKLAKMQMRLIP
jgi:RNA processing factor Prp31